MEKERFSYPLSEREEEEKFQMETIDYYEALKYDFAKKSVIACGPSHALAIGSNENLYGWGSNQFQQLGDSTARSIIKLPEAIGVVGEYYYNVLQVSCGIKHCAILAYPYNEGKIKYAIASVFTFGSKENGRLGRPIDESVDGEDQNDKYNLEVNNPKTSLGNKPMKMVACGSSFTLALSIHGHIYAWGCGSSGSLGTGYYDDVWEPKHIKIDSKKEEIPLIKFIAAGHAHAVAITENGQMYSWGSGEMGQLGIATPQNTAIPTEAVMPRIKISTASCGMYHTMVVTEDQILFGCGANKNGQLGFPDLSNREKLEEVTFFINEPVNWVACGANHTLALTLSHKVFAFGNNKHFKCGVHEIQEHSKNIAVPTEVAIPLDMNDYIYQIAASLNMSMAISKNGVVYTWGKSSGGLLGRSLATAKTPGIKINEEGAGTQIFDNNNNQGNEYEESLEVNGPHEVEKFFLKKEGETGENDKLSITVKDLHCGFSHTVALTNAGELFVWGSNEYGQHGVSSKELQKIHETKQPEINNKVIDLPSECLPSIVPQFDIRQNKKVTHVATGYYHVIAVENYRKVYSWGRNYEGQLGLGYSCKEVTEPSPVSELTGHIIKQIAASEAHSLVISEFGDLFAFGSPLYGRLGLGIVSSLQLTPRRIKDLPKVVQIRCGPTHSMAIIREKVSFEDEEPRYDDVLYTWGSGWGGKLGHGNLDNYFVPTRVDTSVRFSEIACGYNHSAGISTKGKIYVWGPREYFGLVEIKLSEVLGSYKAKPSDLYLLKPTLFEHHIFGHFSFKQIVLGNNYSIALSENNVMYKWGNFDNIIAEEFKKMEEHQHFDKELAELIRIEKHSNMLKNTFHSLPSMQDLIVGVDCAGNHAVAYSDRCAYSWGIDSYTGRLGHSGDILDLNGNKDKEDNSDTNTKNIHHKRLDQPKIIKFLSNIFNRNTQKIANQKQEEAANDAKSEVTKRSGRSRKSVESKRTINNKSRISARGSSAAKLNASSRTSLIGSDDENGEKGTTAVKQFIELLNDKETKDRYKNVVLHTERLETKVRDVYKMYKELKMASNKVSEFSKSTENLIISRLITQPFNITPSNKHIMKLPLEFTENKEAYRRLYTILQLHPCYLRNIYRERKIPLLKLYRIIKEIFGDLEGDRRKIKLFITVSLEILKEELKNKDSNELNFDSLTDEVNGTPLFTRLFKHLIKSDPQNIEYLNAVELKLKQTTESEIQKVANKFLKQFALIFKGKEVAQIMERYKNENEAFKLGEMEKIVKRVRDATEIVIEEISKKLIPDKKELSVSEDIKFLLGECISITKNSFTDTDIILGKIQSKAMALIFVPMREKISKNYHSEVGLNMNNLADAFLMYVKETTFPDDHDKWVGKLNKSILQGHEKRRNLLKTFSIDRDAYDFQDRNLEATFYHSTELENDKIQCKIDSIACLTTFLAENCQKVAVIHPQKLDFIVKFKETLNPKHNYINKTPSPQEGRIIVNLKLKTRQLLYGEDSTMKICNLCGVYLKEALSSTNSRPIIQHLSTEDPRSLETYYKKFLRDLDERRIEVLLDATEEFDTFAKKSFENYKGRGEYEKVSNVAVFTKALDDELESKYPWFKERFKSQEINVMKYNVLKHLQTILTIRFNEEKAYGREVENMEETFDVAIIPIVRETLHWRNKELLNSKTIIDAIKYGSSIQNPKADKILSKNRQSIYSAVRSHLNRKTQSKDLVENLSNEEKQKLLLFGKYTLSVLKLKNILVDFEDPLASAESKGKKKNNIKKYSLIFTKTEDKYVISLIYSTKKNTLVSLLVRSNKEFEEIVDEVTLTEKDLLIIRQSMPKGKESSVKTTKIGKYLEVNTVKFFELLEALNSNQGIYEQQIVRRQGERIDENPSKGHIHHNNAEEHPTVRSNHAKLDARFSQSQNL